MWRASAFRSSTQSRMRTAAPSAVASARAFDWLILVWELRSTSEPGAIEESTPKQPATIGSIPVERLQSRPATAFVGGWRCGFHHSDYGAGLRSAHLGWTPSELHASVLRLRACFSRLGEHAATPLSGWPGSGQAAGRSPHESLGRWRGHVGAMMDVDIPAGRRNRVSRRDCGCHGRGVTESAITCLSARQCRLARRIRPHAEKHGSSWASPVSLMVTVNNRRP
jgi:hypothetical protein